MRVESAASAGRSRVSRATQSWAVDSTKCSATSCLLQKQISITAVTQRPASSKSIGNHDIVSPIHAFKVTHYAYIYIDAAVSSTGISNKFCAY